MKCPLNSAILQVEKDQIPGSTAQTIARTWQVNRGTIVRNGFNAVGVEVMGNAVVAAGGYTARIVYRAVSSATKATVKERRLGAL